MGLTACGWRQLHCTKLQSPAGFSVWPRNGVVTKKGSKGVDAAERRVIGTSGRLSISLATACDICTSIHRSIALFYPSPGPTKRGASKQGWTCFPTLHQPFPRLAWPARSEISESWEGAAYERVRRFWYTVQYPAGVRRRLQLLSARPIDLASCRSEARKAGRGRLLATVFDSITS